MSKGVWVTKHGELVEEKLAELTKRVSVLETMLQMSGIIERLDMTDIISTEDNDPWSMYSNTLFKVKRVKS